MNNEKKFHKKIMLFGAIIAGVLLFNFGKSTR